MKYSFLKKAPLIFVFLLASIIFLTPSVTHAQTPSVTISSPNGGEEYMVGDEVLIFWSSNAAVNCSLYYITPEGGPSMAYYIGNASSSAGFLSWTAAKPSEDVAVQAEKVQISCVGMPTDYSDNYFTVSSPVSSPTPTPTLAPSPTPTPTPTIVCNRQASVAFTNTASQSAFPGQSIQNSVAITNNNDIGCGARLYGLSQAYPGGWTMNSQPSVVVSPGSTEIVPLTLTSPTEAEYKKYSYSILVGDSSGGVLVGTTAYVTIIPRCDATVLATLSSTSHSVNPGTTISNSLVLTNPNHAQCAAKTYVFSRSFPTGWTLSMQPNVTVQSGQTVTVPFSLAVASSASVSSYGYSFSIYNSWVDGSGTANVDGAVTVLDNVEPTVVITTPANNSTVARNKTIAINATATDNVGISKVEFYINGVLTCTDLTATFTCSFKTQNRKGKIYTLTAKAYDSSNNSTITYSTVKTN